MLILACDTSGPAVSVALWQNGQVIAETMRNTGLTHSVTFMPLVSQLLRENGLQPADVTHYAVTTGPGSFTGIRIGISAVKAMAYAAARPVLGFSTLAVLAWPYRSCVRTLVCPALDARNGRVYAAAWLRADLQIEQAVRPLSDFCAAVAQCVQVQSDISSVLMVGVPLSDEQLAVISRHTAVALAPRSAWLPQAASLAELAADGVGRGETLRPEDLKANYLNVSSAERLRAARHE